MSWRFSPGAAGVVRHANGGRFGRSDGYADASPRGACSQRFTSRRERIQHGVALLASSGCCRVRNRGGSLTYTITEAGQDLGGRFIATYATSLTTVAGIVVRQLRKPTDKTLREQTERWLILQQRFVS
ncbi:ABC-three component system middle component 2 [Streptomyces sp. TRM75563]|uniref:ABC-three component system middle component 2 n=1 Tax=Streptomyces sp. TRM75563 TaxID=2817418 RepID=UPI001F6072A8|nr:ABC-three component system middle component 2 [Streptomyces sp. TRM75563]MCI4039792.1 hypothetical protein [Streptomyces sp. TRM75563]